MWGEAAQCAIPTEASRGAGRAAGRLFEAAEFLLCGGGLPEANDAGIVSVSIAAGICGGRGGSDRRAAARSDAGQSEATSGHCGSEPPYGRTMAAMVAGGVSAEFVLEMGERTVGPAGGRASAAVIVAGVVSEARGRRKDDPFAALHPAFNDDIDRARNLRFAIGPQRMPVDSGGAPLIGFAVGGQNADSEPLRKSETDAGR